MISKISDNDELWNRIYSKLIKEWIIRISFMKFYNNYILLMNNICSFFFKFVIDSPTKFIIKRSWTRLSNCADHFQFKWNSKIYSRFFVITASLQTAINSSYPKIKIYNYAELEFNQNAKRKQIIVLRIISTNKIYTNLMISNPFPIEYMFEFSCIFDFIIFQFSILKLKLLD